MRTAGSEPEITTGEYVAGNYFPVLGLKPAIGRLIGPEDAPAKCRGGELVLLEHPVPSGSGDPRPANRVQDKPATIVGVAPREFFGVLVGSRTDVWLPRSAEMG